MTSLHAQGDLYRVIRISARVIGCIGIALLMANVFLHIFDILCRWLASAPQSWVADAYEVTLPVAIAACFPLTVYERGMIAVRFLGGWLGGTAGKTLDILGGMALLAVLAVITWQTFLYAGDALVTGRSSFLLGIPLAPTWYAAGLLFGLSALIHAVVVLTGPVAPAEGQTSDGL